MLQNNIIYSELNDWIIQYYSRSVIGFNDHSMRHYIWHVFNINQTTTTPETQPGVAAQ